MTNGPSAAGLQLRFHPHPAPLLGLLLALSLTWFVYAALLCPISESFGVDGSCVLFTATGFSLVGSALILDWLLTIYFISANQVGVCRGILARSEMIMGKEMIQDVRINQSLVGRVLDYGDLIVESAGAMGRIVLSAVPRPQQVAHLLENNPRSSLNQ